MPSISFPGLGSGLQVSEIVDAIVGAEKAPFESRLNQQAGKITTDISAVGALRSALEDVANSMASLADADNYQTRTTSGADEFLSLTSSKDSQVGNYNVKVDELAATHKLSSAAIDEAEAVGEGTLTFNSGSESFDIAVSGTNTLSEIRDAINDSSDNDSIVATIITDDIGEHLVLTSKETGAANAITITVDDVSDGNDTDNIGLSRLAYDPDALPTAITNLTQVQAATDAKITIDGTISVTSSTNKFTEVIDGIDITVAKKHGVDDDDSSIAISENNNNINTGLNSFIKSYNGLLELSKTLGQVGDGGTGALAGDSLLRGVMGKLRQELSNNFDSGDGETLSLSQLGVRADRYGVLSLDADELNDFIEADVDRVQTFFVGADGDTGFANSLKELTDFYTESDGIIEGRIESREAQLNRLDEDRINFNRKMESLEARLYAQYNAMDLLVAGLNSTSTYLMAQLDNMPGVVKKDN